MKLKRTLALVACAAIALIAAPAANAATTATGTITVKWNTQAIGSVTMVADYDAAGHGGHTDSTTPTVYTAANGGAGLCTATGGGVPADDLTADFSSVTPDNTQTTDCLYKNAVNAKVISSDTTSWNVAVSGTVPAAQGILCEFPNGTYANNLAVTTSARSAAVAAITTAASCTAASGYPIIPGGTTLLTVPGANTAGTNLGGDIELALAPLAGSGAQSIVVTYTLTMN